MARRRRDDDQWLSAAHTAAQRARAFGKLVEAELAKGRNVRAAMTAIHRREPRWGSRSTMFALWEAHLADKARKAQAEQEQQERIDAIHAGVKQLGPWASAKYEAATTTGGVGNPRWRLYARALAILWRNRFFWTRS